MTQMNTIIAELREDVGKGASRRLRHEGRVPAILYGGHKDPVNLSLDHTVLLHEAGHEAFYSSILELEVDGKGTQRVVVRDLHRHPFKLQIMHVDFLRVSETETLRLTVPIHFTGEKQSPAGKASGVVIQHQVTEVEIQALPKDLPEFLEVDLSKMEPGDSVWLSEIVLPEGVKIVQLLSGDDNDTTIANAVHIRETQGEGVLAAEADAELAEAEEMEASEAEAAADDEEGEEGAEGEEGDEDASEEDDKDAS